MKLNISYDSTTLANAPPAFFTAVSYVVNLFDSTFTNNSTVNIEVGYGDFPEDGSPVTSLGTSDQNNVVFSDYSTVRQILRNDGAPGATTLPSNSPLSGQLTLGSAQEKALGLLGANTSLDGWVGIASNAELQQMGIGSWSFSPTATPSSSQFYIVGVLEHEFSEVMGRISYLDQRGEYGVMDLYRYARSGVRQTGTGDPAYFSINGGNTNLDNWNDSSISGGDLGDWAPNPASLDSSNYVQAVADAFLSESPPGQINSLSATDLTLMAALGWNATPARPGNQYVFSAPGKTVNLVSTNDGTNLPAAIAGQFNIELVTQPVGTAYPLPTGYQAVAILPGGTGVALQVLNGDLMVADTGSGDAITLGSGADTVTGATRDTIVGGSGSASINGAAGPESIGGGSGASTILGGTGDTITGSTGSGAAVIIGAAGDTITGGSGSDLINGTAGSDSITGGTGSTTVLAGSGDSITGGAGQLTVEGGFGNNMVITGGAGGLNAFDFGAGNNVKGTGGSTTINDAYGAGGGRNTLTGGNGPTNDLLGNVSDTLIGGSGSGVTLFDGTLGTQTISGGSAFGVQVEGGKGDVIAAGSATSVLIYADQGFQTVTGNTNGTFSSTQVILGASDSIVGDAGPLTVAGNAAANATVLGNAGSLFAFNLGPHDSVVGSTGPGGLTVINDAYGSGGNNTLIGGTGTNTSKFIDGFTVASAVNSVIVAGSNDSIVGQAGVLEARILASTTGVETVNLSAAGAGSVVRDVNDVTKGGAASSVTGFNTATDFIASAQSVKSGGGTGSGALVAGSAAQIGADTVINFGDGSKMTLLGTTLSSVQFIQ